MKELTLNYEAILTKIMKSINGMFKLIQPLRVTLVLTLLSATLAINTNSTIKLDDSSAGHINLTSNT